MLMRLMFVLCCYHVDIVSVRVVVTYACVSVGGCVGFVVVVDDVVVADVVIVVVVDVVVIGDAGRFGCAVVIIDCVVVLTVNGVVGGVVICCVVVVDVIDVGVGCVAVAVTVWYAVYVTFVVYVHDNCMHGVCVVRVVRIVCFVMTTIVAFCVYDVVRSVGVAVVGGVVGGVLVLLVFVFVPVVVFVSVVLLSLMWACCRYVYCC